MNPNNPDIKPIPEPICPVSGLTIICKPEWTDVDLGEEYSVTFKFIGDRILLSIPQGYAGKLSVENYFKERTKVLGTMLKPGEPFFELRDYTNIKKSPSKAARNQYTKGMKADQDRIIGFIGFCAPLPIKLAANVGKHLYKATFPLTIVNDYETAIQKAVEELNFHGHNPTQRHHKVTSHSDWGFKEQGYSSKSTKEYADELLGFVGKINWEMEGVNENKREIIPSHPFKPVFDAIELIKNDLDGLLQERKTAETELKTAKEETDAANKELKAVNKQL